MTVLFADLVGFTSRAEQLDPEDVRAILEPYHARLRTELERFGGTVEKFIGDAVMALFGAPVAHEDDPERAVRAALAIRDWIARGGRAPGARRRHDRRGARLARRPAGRGRGHGLRRRRQHRGAPPVRGARSTGSSSTRRRIARRSSAIDVPRAASRSRRRARRSRSASGRPSRRGRASASTSRRRADAPLVGRDRELEPPARRARSGRGRSARRSSSRSSASRESARAASSTSCSQRVEPSPS